MKKKKKTEKLVETRLMTGDTAFVGESNIVGYCHFSEHKGQMTKTLVQSHNCFKKECHYLEKYKDSPYWQALETQREAEIRKKETAKRLKAEEMERQAQWCSTAQKAADENGFKLKVTEVKKLPRKKEYVIFYRANSRFDKQNNMSEYVKLCRRLFGVKVTPVKIER